MQESAIPASPFGQSSHSKKQGADTPELLRNFPSLTTDDLSNARFYYTAHQEEIDRAIASHQYEQEEAIIG